MFDCKEVTRRVSESMDRRLPLYQRLMIRFHLKMCHLCDTYHKQMHFIREVSKCYAHASEKDNIPQCIMDAAARTRIKSVLQKQMDAEQEQA